MAAGIAHEIRNPLASMSGSMQLLRQELQLTTEQAQLFDIVARESDRLNDTIRNFLAYARPTQPKSRAWTCAQVLKEAAQLIRNNPECQSLHTCRSAGARPRGELRSGRSADPADRVEPGDQRASAPCRRAAC